MLDVVRLTRSRFNEGDLESAECNCLHHLTPEFTIFTLRQLRNTLESSRALSRVAPLAAPYLKFALQPELSGAKQLQEDHAPERTDAVAEVRMKRYAVRTNSCSARGWERLPARRGVNISPPFVAQLPQHKREARVATEFMRPLFIHSTVLNGQIGLYFT
jgi:hypothetical protein